MNNKLKTFPYHGGCVGCLNKYKGKTFCEQCQYFDADWSLQNLANYKEKVVSDKIQMTEEQFHEMYKDCGHGMIDSQDYKDWKFNMLEKGYIKKTGLQQKVEDVEEMYKQWLNYKIGDNVKFNGEAELMKLLYAVFQLLKKDHPEFKHE